MRDTPRTAPRRPSPRASWRTPWTPPLRMGLALCLPLVLAVGTADAARVFRWTTPEGERQYGDHVPEHIDPEESEVVRIPVRAEPSAIARLRLENTTDSIEAWADNLSAGPIEVELRAGPGGSVGAVPPLPARALVPAYQRLLIARLPPETRSEYFMDVVPGDPGAEPRDVEYLYPLDMVGLHVEQGFGGAFSHRDAENRYAVDFAAPIGTRVLAARAGTVIQVESDFSRAGLNAEKFAGRANYVRILHDDGTMALYAHLTLDGVLVRVGQRVRKGQIIGLSGNTGFTSGPHLHFVVQVNRGLRLQSVPFRMFGPQGILQFLETRRSPLDPPGAPPEPPKGILRLGEPRRPG